MKKLGSATDPLWYKDAVIYELHVRAFQDSNGDGIGDFPGLISRLDYLQDLGVTCLWLLPFFPSPLRDDGYDIADYTGVHPSYGTLEDFKQFLDELAVARGGDHCIHPIAELHQAHTALIVHRQAHNALECCRSRVVETDLRCAGNSFAVIRSRLLQLSPSPEESTSSRPEPPLDS